MSAQAEALQTRLQAMIDTLRTAAVVHGVPSACAVGAEARVDAVASRAVALRHEAGVLEISASSLLLTGACGSSVVHRGVASRAAASVPAAPQAAAPQAADPETDEPLVSLSPASERRVIRKHVDAPKPIQHAGDDDFLVRFDHGPSADTTSTAFPSEPAAVQAPQAPPASWVHQAVQPIVELGPSTEKDFTGPSLSTFAAAVRSSDIGLDELVPAPVRTAPFPDEDDAWLTDAQPQTGTVQVTSLDSRDYILSEPTDRLVIRPPTGRRRSQPSPQAEAPPDPTDVQSWLRRAQERTTMAPQEAIGLYTDVLDVLPGHLDARLGRARLYTDGGQLAQAASDLIRAERLAPHHPDLHHCYGDLFFRDKSYEMAIPHYSRVLRQHNNSIMALYRRGLCYYYAQNIMRAREDLQRVRALDPTLPGLETSLAQLDGAV